MIYPVPQYSGAQLRGGGQGGMLLSKEGLPPPQKSTLFCNLAIHEILEKRKGVYCVFLDIFTISSATYYDIALKL